MGSGRHTKAHLLRPRRTARHGLIAMIAAAGVVTATGAYYATTGTDGDVAVTVAQEHPTQEIRDTHTDVTRGSARQEPTTPVTVSPQPEATSTVAPLITAAQPGAASTGTHPHTGSANTEQTSPATHRTTTGSTPQKPAQTTAPTKTPKPQAPAPVTSQKPAPQPAGQSAQQVLTLVNKERTAAGLKPLQLDSCLSSKVAQPWAETMSRAGRIWHQNMSNISKQCPGNRSVAENVAMGQTSASSVMDSWMRSPGHRRNIMSASYTKLGVGVAKDSHGRLYWVQNFGG